MAFAGIQEGNAGGITANAPLKRAAASEASWGRQPMPPRTGLLGRPPRSSPCIPGHWAIEKQVLAAAPKPPL